MAHITLIIFLQEKKIVYIRFFPKIITIYFKQKTKFDQKIYYNYDKLAHF